MTVRRTVFLRVSYDPSSVWSRLVSTVHDVRDDSSTISGDAYCLITRKNSLGIPDVFFGYFKSQFGKHLS